MSAGIEAWPDRLERIVKECVLFRRVFVLRETDSTQDAARRMNAQAGDVVVAWRQTAGRGRLGRKWADTAEDGIAMTLLLPREEERPQRLVMAAAVGTARAAEFFLKQPVHIKWPNDILVNGRKLAGILIEQVDSLALMGIGLNVSQKQWEAELADRAVSLAQLGCEVDRLDVLSALLPALDCAFLMDTPALTKEQYRRGAQIAENELIDRGDGGPQCPPA